MKTASPPPWYRLRRYLHFDCPVGLKRAEALVMDPHAVACHAFYPLISYDLTSKKLTADRLTKKLVPREKTRPISYAAHLDAHIYNYYATCSAHDMKHFSRHMVSRIRSWRLGNSAKITSILRQRLSRRFAAVALVLPWHLILLDSSIILTMNC